MRTKRTRTVFYKGKKLSITELVNDPELNPLMLSYNCVRKRLSSGRSVKEAMSKPMEPRSKRTGGEPTSFTMKGVHPAIKHEMLYGTNNSFLRACEKYGGEGD